MITDFVGLIDFFIFIWYNLQSGIDLIFTAWTTYQNKEESGDLLARALGIFKGKRSDIDMTEGSIYKNLISFALPLLAGNLFQQLYNLVDTWVIGQTGENGAFAAVGSVGPVINILIGFFLGLSSGAGVIISQYFGAKKEEDVSKVVHTSMLMTIILGVIFTAVGIFMTPTLLDLMLRNNDNKQEIYPHALTYLTVYFSGVMGLMVYNMGAGILRAIGDSKHPFYFLLVSAVTNTVLDLVFVVFVFDPEMSAFGVALATIISQFLSAILTLYVLLRNDTCVKLFPSKLKIHWDMLRKIIKIGIPAALQMALTAFANVFVQSYIAGVSVDNQTACLSGWTSYSKVDMIIFLPVQSLALAATTFVGQNLGVGNVERAKKGTMAAYLMATAGAIAIIVPVIIFAPAIASIINPDPAVVKYATIFLRYISPFYLLCCINQVFAGALRGAGKTNANMIIMLSTFVGFRQLYLFIMSNFISNDPIPIGMSYPAGWLACAILTLIYYKFCKFEKNTVIGN